MNTEVSTDCDVHLPSSLYFGIHRLSHSLLSARALVEKRRHARPVDRARRKPDEAVKAQLQALKRKV